MALEYAYHLYSMACLQVYLSQTTAANRFAPNLISSFIDTEKHTGSVFSELLHRWAETSAGVFCVTQIVH